MCCVMIQNCVSLINIAEAINSTTAHSNYIQREKEHFLTFPIALLLARSTLC